MSMFWIYYIFFILYSSLALHKLWYFNLGEHMKTYLDKIVKFQKWAIRTISLEHNWSHTGPLFNKHNILNVFDTFKLKLGVFMYKHQADLLPQAFSNYFVKHNQIQNTEDYSIHKAKKMFSDRSIRITGPTLWNSLDNEIKYCKTT